jgi:hypothetical protein
MTNATRTVPTNSLWSRGGSETETVATGASSLGHFGGEATESPLGMRAINRNNNLLSALMAGLTLEVTGAL